MPIGLRGVGRTVLRGLDQRKVTATLTLAETLGHHLGHLLQGQELALGEAIRAAFDLPNEIYPCLAFH